MVTKSRRPRGDVNARRAAFVAAARELFFAHGYAATAMSAIAAKVGGSKTTLWSYFPAKEDLFAAVVDDIAEHYATALNVVFTADEAFPDALRRYGRAMLETIQSPPIVELQRMVMGEAPRFPELGRVFWDRGPARGKARLTELIAARMAAGELRVGDAGEATMLFAGMCQMGPHQMHLMGLVPAMTPGQMAHVVDLAADTFCRAWLVSASPRAIP